MVTSALHSITGTAFGGLAGIKPRGDVSVQITTDPATGPFWTGSSYTFTANTWSTSVVTGNNWTYSDLTGAFPTDGLRYYIYSRVTDDVGNQQASATAYSVVIQPPVVVTTFPVSGVYYNAARLEALAGTASAGGASVTSVEALLKSKFLGSYWDGAGGFGAGPGNWVTMGGTSQWSKALPPLSDNVGYVLWTRATDSVPNVSTYPAVGAADYQLANNQNANGSPALSFTYDNLLPVSYLTFPAPNSVIRDVSTLDKSSGTAYSNTGDATGAAPVDQVMLNLRCSGCGPTNNPAWWTGTWSEAGEPAPMFLTNFSAPNWDFHFSNTWEDGYQYSVYARARDTAQNLEAPESASSFIVDFTTPVARATAPVDGGFVGMGGAGVTLYGTADDRFCTLASPLCMANRKYEAGILGSSVTLALQRAFDGKYWNGGSFGSDTPVWSSAAFAGQSSGTWSYALSTSALMSPASYYVSARAQDRAGNFSVQLTTISFTYDTTKPVSLATAPAGTVEALSVLYGTARDDAPGQLRVVSVQIKETECSSIIQCNINKYWNGVGWQDNPVFLSSGIVGALISDTTRQWTMNLSAVDWNNHSTYTVTVAAIDRSSNTESGHTDISFNLESPAASVFISNVSNDQQFGPFNAGAINTLTGTGGNMKVPDGVRVKLQRLTEPTSYWYDGSASWTNDASTYTLGVVVGAGASQTWSKSLASPYTVDNASYTVTVTAVDIVGQSGEIKSRVFYYDRTGPLIGIGQLSPSSCLAANACVKLMPTIFGTANDPGSAAAAQGIASIAPSDVFVRLLRNSDGSHWTGSGWGSSADFSPGGANFSPSGTPPTYSWSTAAFAGATLNDGFKYKVLAHARDTPGNDRAGGDENSMTLFTLLYDTSPPTAFLIQPSSGEVYSAVGALGGTARDRYSDANKESDVDHVEIQIKDPVGFCWSKTGSGQFDAACPNYIVVSGTDPWSYSHANLSPQMELASGKQFTITARAVDRSSNTQSAFSSGVSSSTLAIDRNPPTAAITTPEQGKAYRKAGLDGPSALVGTASDAEENLYPDQDALQPGQNIVIWYLEGNTSYYYTGQQNEPPSANGTYFSSNTVESSQWRVLTTTDAWTYAFTGARWVSDKPYYVKARARDRARDATGAPVGNVSTAFTPGTNLVSFIVDDTPPVSRVNYPPQTGYIKNLATISGTSNADAAQNSLAKGGTYYLHIWYRNAGNDYYWNGFSWSGTPDLQTQLPVQIVGSTGTVLWIYPGNTGRDSPTVQADGTQHFVSIAAQDNAGNLETPTTVQFISDSNGPSVTISTPML